MAVHLFLAFTAVGALRLPSSPAGRQSVASLNRRELAPFAATAAAAFLSFPAIGNAYDSLPTVDPDFEKIERLRLEREAASRKKMQQVNSFIKDIEASKDKEQFIKGADAFAIYIIGEGKFPEGLKVKDMVKRITEAYEALPKQKFFCEATRTNQGICFSPGKDAEAAYEALIKEIRQYSLIQLGDYRTVTFKAF